MANFRIEPARIEDCGVILSFIRDLAEYERLLDQVVATEDDVRRELFGEKSVIRAVVAWEDDKPVGFALYFFNFSTYLTFLKISIFVIRKSFTSRNNYK